jgi:hypothetical protein
MKKMKFGLFGAMAIASAMFFTGCTDPCKDVVCTNGECTDGTCVCDTGYEGETCGTAMNEKFTGTFNLTETCAPSGTAGPYAVTLNPKTTSPTEFTFVGLWEEAQSVVTGKVGTDGTSFTIERQALSASFDISGSGSISTAGTSITITYSVYATGSTTAADACSGTMTK